MTRTLHALMPAVVTVLVALAVLVGAGNLARADETAPDGKLSLKAHYEQGTRLYDMGRYDDAAAEFQRTFELSGAPDLLFNIAQSYRHARRFEESLRAYRGYLRRVPDAANHDYVEKRIDEVQAALAQQQQEAAARAAAEATRASRLTAAPMPGTLTITTAPPRPARSPSEKRKLRRAGYALFGVAALTLAGAVTTTLLSHAAQTTIEGDAQKSQPFSSALQKLYTTGRAEAAAGDALFAVGGVLTIAAATTLALGWPRRAHELAFVPSLGNHAAGLAVAGAF